MSLSSSPSGIQARATKVNTIEHTPFFFILVLRFNAFLPPPPPFPFTFFVSYNQGERRHDTEVHDAGRSGCRCSKRGSGTANDNTMLSSRGGRRTRTLPSETASPWTMHHMLHPLPVALRVGIIFFGFVMGDAPLEGSSLIRA
jgi:hypothetical protein